MCLKRVLVGFLMAWMACGVYAARLTNATKMRIAQQECESCPASRLKSGVEEERVLTTILLYEGCKITDEILDSLNADVKVKRGRIIIADVPLGKIERLSQMKEIKLIDTGSTMNCSNDFSREASSVDLVHDEDVRKDDSETNEMTKKYRGKGVLVGIIDTEIDLGHPAFRNAEGQSRIKFARIVTSENKVYDYDENMIEDAIREGNRDSLKNEGHGTHVTGIAAGSTALLTNGDPMKRYHGMAPESDLLVYDLYNFVTTDILAAMASAFDKAEQLQQPIVLNCSFGRNSAQLDGTDDVNESLVALLETYDMEGKIICVSANNDAKKKICVQISCDQPVVDNNWTLQKKVAFNGNHPKASEVLSFYGADDREFAVRYEFYDSEKHTKVASSPLLTYENIKLMGNKVIEMKSDSDSYCPFTVRIAASAYRSSANRYYHEVKMQNHFGVSTYAVASIYTRQTGLKIDGALMNNEFLVMEDEDYAIPNSYGSINQRACTDHVISVGSYNTRMSYTDFSGKEQRIGPDSENGDIAPTSSYRTSHYGTQLPNVLAPGRQIISAYHHEFPYSSKPYVGSTSYQGINYLWGAKTGTSMACPAATGIIALWLQANPKLTVDDVRNIIRLTSDYDSHCHAEPDRAGMGKINAFRGLEYILSATGIRNMNSEGRIRDKYLMPNGKVVLQIKNRLYDAAGQRLK